MHVKLLGLDLAEPNRVFDKILVSVGRRPNSRDIGLENTAVEVDDKGFIKTDHQRRTAEPHIFAIGDVAGRTDAGPQGQLRGTRGGGSARRQSVRVRPEVHPGRRVHRSGAGLGRTDRNRGAQSQHPVQDRRVPVGGCRSRYVAGSQRRPDQDDRRSQRRVDSGDRDRRRGCRRADRRGGLGDRNGMHDHRPAR